MSDRGLLYLPFVAGLLAAGAACGVRTGLDVLGAGGAGGATSAGTGGAHAATGTGGHATGGHPTGGGHDAGCTTFMSCQEQGKNCGFTPDGCGHVLDCGQCPPGVACGGSGIPNVCGTSCVPETCGSQGFDCGFAMDGCGHMIDCGPCPPGSACGGTGIPNVCGPICVPQTCQSLGFQCGAAGDGCGGLIQCGPCPPGEQCGGGGAPPGHCGPIGCSKKTCAEQGFDCGMATDGCGDVIDCGTCPTGGCPGMTCGGGGSPNVCGTGDCMCLTCQELGFDCGQTADGCGGILDCGTCPGNQVCGLVTPNVCGTPMTCDAGTTTATLTGKVYVPNGVDVLYKATVYVPGSAVSPFPPGVTCDPCGGQITGNPIVTTTSGIDGSFTLTGVPAGANVPLVIQLGRWRRQVVIPSVPACGTVPLPASLTRMPKNTTEGDIPQIAVVTGAVDTLECVLRKFGLDDSAFSDPGGPGRVQLFQGAGGVMATGASYSATTPFESALWGSQAAINAYDMVLFACQGSQFDQTSAAQQVVINYANAGGRIFATHYNYVWLYDDAPFSATASWMVMQNPNFSADPETASIVTTFPKGQALAQWLQAIGASTTFGQVTLQALRTDFLGVVPPSQLWIQISDANNPSPVPMHFTFDTPVGVPPPSQCGRVAFNDYHVEDAANNPVTQGTLFPQECTTPGMSAQEKMLEFMLFDLGSCP